MNKPVVVLVIMDGVGESADELGNMVLKASTPTLANVAPTIADLLGLKPFASWEESMI